MSRDREVPRRSAPPLPPVQARDVALGIAVVGVRGAVVGARLLILPARGRDADAASKPHDTKAGERGRASRLRVRAQLTATGEGLLAAPEVDAFGRALAEHHVIERVARRSWPTRRSMMRSPRSSRRSGRAGSWCRDR